jgi:protein-L-isoaspartate(D-aspartate) O-methyltransferase
MALSMMEKIAEFTERLKLLKIKSEVIDAMRAVDMREFVDPFFAPRCYDAGTVPIEYGQTLEDPFVLAKMLHLLSIEKEWRLLEVGTGSGFSSAIISKIASEVVTVDIIEGLAVEAKKRVLTNGGRNVRFFAGDATAMTEELGEFDGIIVFGACAHTPYSLINILSDNGRAVFPLGPASKQQLTRYSFDAADENKKGVFTFSDYCEFGSLRGRYGWTDQNILPCSEVENRGNF